MSEATAVPTEPQPLHNVSLPFGELDLNASMLASLCSKSLWRYLPFLFAHSFVAS